MSALITEPTQAATLGFPKGAQAARTLAHAFREDLERRRQAQAPVRGVVDPRDAVYQTIVAQVKTTVWEAIQAGQPEVTVKFERLEWMQGNVFPTALDAREYVWFRLQTESLAGYAVNVILHDSPDDDGYVWNEFHVRVRWE